MNFLDFYATLGFIYSQPIGEQAEVADLRWLVGATCKLPAVLNNGLIGWAKSSWFVVSGRNGRDRANNECA